MDSGMDPNGRLMKGLLPIWSRSPSVENGCFRSTFCWRITLLAAPMSRKKLLAQATGQIGETLRQTLEFAFKEDRCG